MHSNIKTIKRANINTRKHELNNLFKTNAYNKCCTKKLKIIKNSRKKEYDLYADVKGAGVILLGL